MSSITGRANLLLTTSIGGGVQMGIKKLPEGSFLLSLILRRDNIEPEFKFVHVAQHFIELRAVT